ncbi:MAG: hypothetical protein HY769_03620, partial [Candidatus Stahlbacteria bacterium]|nr:hypothetical protein [Candidatus Stahlbacteria bacterium]
MRRKIILVCSIFIFCLGNAQLINIDVDCDSVIGEIKSLQGMNCGPLPIRSWGADLSQQFREIGVDYVRTHDVMIRYDSITILVWDIDYIFPDSLANPYDPLSYNFIPADSQIQAIINAGAKPFIRLGYSKPYYIGVEFRRKWAEICKHIIMHYNDGWATGFYYDIEYCEIWNEPDIPNFWTGTSSEFYALYDTTAKVLKSYNPNLIVGGPGIAWVQGNWIVDFLDYCKTNSVPLDFISWHTYEDTINANPYIVFRKAEIVQQLLDSFNLPIPQYLTEWNISERQNPWWTCGIKGGAYTASFLVYMQNTPITMAHRYRANANSSGPPSSATWYIDGSYTKPAYAFMAFKKLIETPNRISCNGSDVLGYAVITGKSETGDTVTILISDFQSPNQG